MTHVDKYPSNSLVEQCEPNRQRAVTPRSLTHSHTHWHNIGDERGKNGFLWVFYSNDRYHELPHRDFYSHPFSPYRCVTYVINCSSWRCHCCWCWCCLTLPSPELFWTACLTRSLCSILKFDTVYNRMHSARSCCLLLLLLLLSRFSYWPILLNNYEFANKYVKHWAPAEG